MGPAIRQSEQTAQLPVLLGQRPLSSDRCYQGIHLSPQEVEIEGTLPGSGDCPVDLDEGLSTVSRRR